MQKTTMKVIHPITRLIVGGAQQNTVDTCTYLDKERFAATIISGKQTGAEGEIISEVQRRGVPLLLLPELVREISPLNDLRAFVKLFRYFRREKPQIVHTHSSKAGILGRWAAWYAGVPVIVHTVHGWGHHSYQNSLKKSSFIWLERLTERITDKLVVVSELNREKGLQDRIGTPEKYSTVHSCIDVDDFCKGREDRARLKAELGLKPDSLVVGTVGRFSPQKNPLDFVRVAKSVKAQIPAAQFLYVGDGPMRGLTDRMIVESGLSGEVALPGLRNDVPEMMHCMDVFLLTSLWEGLPRVIPQAMAAGLPVVANGVDGVCEVLDDGLNGFCMQPRTINATAERVVQLLRDKQLRNTMGAAGREKAVREFSLQTMIEQLDGLYRQLLAAKGVHFDQGRA